MIESTTPRGCATTATTSTEEPKNLGIAPMTNFTLTECARTAILTPITRREERKKAKKELRRMKLRPD